VASGGAPLGFGLSTAPLRKRGTSTAVGKSSDAPLPAASADSGVSAAQGPQAEEARQHQADASGEAVSPECFWWPGENPPSSPQPPREPPLSGATLAQPDGECFRDCRSRVCGHGGSHSFDAAAQQTTTFENDASLVLGSAQLSSFNSIAPAPACLCGLEQGEAPSLVRRFGRTISARETSASASAPQLGVVCNREACNREVPLQRGSKMASGGDGELGVELAKCSKGRSVCLDFL
jgi:hypothetical protein